jgi:glycosyltransferase involved in cell wall biosynthesis
MEVLTVAVVIDETHLPSEGGGYTYYRAIINEIDNSDFPETIRVCYVVPPDIETKKAFKRPVLKARFSPVSAIWFHLLQKTYKFVHWLYQDRPVQLLETLARKMSHVRNAGIEQILLENDVDLIYYLKPNDYPVNYPMIATHWDVGHKSMYPFPEVAENGNWQKRESYYLKLLNRAFLILCESQSGMDELVYYYPINRERIKILPLFAGEVVRINVDNDIQQNHLKSFSLEDQNFFVYPAQFWPHKNHYNLIIAFSRLLTRSDRDLKLVLCGADQGNMAYIKRLVARLKLTNNVIITGFVDDEVLHTFYRHAISLVMPTFLGPTNIPLIEAPMLNCPVLCSDLKGHREILHEEALYFNPAKPEEIEKQMLAILNHSLRQELIDRASKRVAESPFNVEKSIKTLSEILEEIRPVRKSWRSGLHFLPFLSYAEWACFT